MVELASKISFGEKKLQLFKYRTIFLMKIESFFKVRDEMQCNAIMFLVYIVRSIGYT